MLDELTNMHEDSALWVTDMSDEPNNAFINGKNSCNQQDCFQSSSSNNKRRCDFVGLSCETACKVIIRAFSAAAEREISIGDGIELWILRRNDNNNNKRINSKIGGKGTSSNFLKRGLLARRKRRNCTDNSFVTSFNTVAADKESSLLSNIPLTENIESSPTIIVENGNYEIKKLYYSLPKH